MHRAILVIGLMGSWCLAQDAANPVEAFHRTLDPRVFQPGGYGPWTEPLGPVFDDAAAQYDVPRELLLALGHIGSAFENRGDQPTIEYGHGVMALRANATGGDSLNTAAAMLGESAETLKTDPRLNILGAAAVLDQYARNAGIDRSRGLDAWLEPVVKYAGLDPENSRFFAMEVFERLQLGIEITNSAGETFAFDAQALSLDLQSLAPKGAAAPRTFSSDYGPAVWDPASSCNYSAYYTAKDTVIVHTIEGSAAGARSWFKNCTAQVSAHFVVSEAGGVWQCVLEDYKAWHVSCYNSRSLGIEHEGYAASSSHPQALYDASALLTRHLCDRWGIPKEKRSVGPGILGHIDVTNCCCGTHTDPGSGWDWTYYINQVKGTPPTPAWAASYSAQSFPSSMTAGSTAVVWAEFTNTGTGHWKHAETRLGTSSPQDRTSAFCTPSNWVGCNRPTDVDQSDVAQSQVGRFTFIITAPATPGTYVEKYKLVREGITWFGPEISWTITVTASLGNLTGTVTSASTGSAIAGATVTLSGVGSTTTNSAGNYTFSGVTAGSYSVSVAAGGYNGANGNVPITAGQTTTQHFSLTPTDTQAPSAPTGLSAVAAGPTSVQLSWTASTDNVAVAGYEVRRNGAVIGSSVTTTYTDNTAGPLSTYTYDLRAKDAVPNYSGWCSSVEVTTPPNPPQPTIVFSDGFDGGLANWTQQTQNYDYSTTVSHGTYAGAGAAYMAATNTDQMYHQFSRPFAQGKVWGWFYDGKGGWKASVCGWAYRQALSLRDFDGTAKMFIDNEFYSASDNTKYFFRTVGAGGITHTAYATRNPNTACSGAWIYFETAVTPGSPGASPNGSFVAKVTDGAGTTTTTQNLTNDYFGYGIGRITLGLGVASTGEAYWDDIAFEATPPGVPTMASPTVLSDTQIRWNFSPADNNVFGYDVASSGGSIVSPQWPSAGWIDHHASSWTESGLAANTQYSRKVRAWNGTLNSASYSNTVSAWTLSSPPMAGSVTPSTTSTCAGDSVTWTAVGGFGAGKIAQYQYAWDQSPAHSFNGSESVWTSGTVTLVAPSAGTWYLHVRGLNGAGVANGSYDYAVTVQPATAITSPPANTAVCAGQNAQFNVSAIGAGLAYQWQKNSADLANGGHYSGVTSWSLTISNADADDAADYRCVITGTCGAVTSVEAELTIKDALTITQQPTASTAYPNSTVTFAVAANGPGSLTYLWQKNGVDLVDGGHYYDVTTPTLTVASASRADSGIYRCIVADDCGSMASDAVMLTVGAPGDLDLDGDVDGSDFGIFAGCFNGTGNPMNGGCGHADLNDDNSVDGIDFGLFSGCFNGAGNPPGC